MTETQTQYDSQFFEDFRTIISKCSAHEGYTYLDANPAVIMGRIANILPERLDTGEFISRQDIAKLESDITCGYNFAKPIYGKKGFSHWEFNEQSLLSALVRLYAIDSLTEGGKLIDRNSEGYVFYVRDKKTGCYTMPLTRHKNGRNAAPLAFNEESFFFERNMFTRAYFLWLKEANERKQKWIKENKEEWEELVAWHNDAMGEECPSKDHQNLLYLPPFLDDPKKDKLPFSYVNKFMQGNVVGAFLSKFLDVVTAKSLVTTRPALGAIEWNGLENEDKKITPFQGNKREEFKLNSLCVRGLHKTTASLADEDIESKKEQMLSLYAHSFAPEGDIGLGRIRCKHFFREYARRLYFAPNKMTPVMWLFGRTNDGKSWILDNIESAVGNICTSGASSLFTKTGYMLQSGVLDLASRMARVVHIHEIDMESGIHEERFKLIAEGKEVTERPGANSGFKRAEIRTKVDFHMVVASNSFPTIKGSGKNAILSRCAFFRFYTPSDEIKQIGIKLDQEKVIFPGTLALLKEAWDSLEREGWPINEPDPDGTNSRYKDHWPETDWEENDDGDDKQSNESIHNFAFRSVEKHRDGDLLIIKRSSLFNALRRADKCEVLRTDLRQTSIELMKKEGFSLKQKRISGEVPAKCFIKKEVFKEKEENKSISEKPVGNESKEAPKVASLSEAIDSLSCAINKTTGASVSNLILDGEWQRFALPEDKGREKSGAYIAHFDERPAGKIKNFKTGEEFPWSFGKEIKFSEKDKEEANRISKQREEDRIESQKDAQENAKELYKNTHRVHVDGTTYSNRKDLEADSPFFDNVHQKEDALLVPLYDENKEIVNVQTIHTDGTKRFLKNGKKKGCFYAPAVEPTEKQTLFVCEGFATGATLSELFPLRNFMPVVAFDCGNISSVCETLHKLYPNNKIVIGADNDFFTEEEIGKNVGLEHAKEALIKFPFVDSVIFPNFDREALREKYGTSKEALKKFSDFNDLYREYGKDGKIETIFK